MLRNDIFSKESFMVFRSTLTVTFFFTLLCIGISESAMASWSVWTEPLLIDKPQQTYNPADKPRSISLKGAKNEWVSFLVCIRGDETLRNFVPSIYLDMQSGSQTIADKNFVFYLLYNHYVDEQGNTYEPPGHWPDAAVPYRDVYYNEIRDSSEAGWGQIVPADTTRVFYIELYIPKEQTAGNYSGTFRLTANDGALQQDIAVNLTVWNFELPEQWSLTNLWGAQLGSWNMDPAAFGVANKEKGKEYNFRLAQSAVMHGFFPHGGGYGNIGPTDSGSFSHADFATDQWSWKKFLDGTVPQGHNPKPYPRTSVYAARAYSGQAMWYKDTAYMDAWTDFIDNNGYRAHTLIVDKQYDEPPSLDAINENEAEFHLRHNNKPLRPMEYWTANSHSYPPESEYWDNPYRQIWTIAQFYTWYRAHDWGEPYGQPSDFNSRRVQYGDILWSYTAGDNDSACNIKTYAKSRNIRAAASSSLDAFSRNNAFVFVSDWVFKTSGHHYWMINQGWENGNDRWTITDPFGKKYNRDGYNGDGFYFYPGRVSGTSHDIGGSHEIPIETLRLKLLRWGAQD